MTWHSTEARNYHLEEWHWDSACCISCNFVLPPWSILSSKPALSANLAKSNRNLKTNASYQSAWKINILHSYFAVSSEALPATEEGELVKSLVLSSVQARQPRRPRSLSRLRPASAEFPASVEIVEDHIGQARGRVRYRDTTASALHGENFLEYSNYRGFPHYEHFGDWKKNVWVGSALAKIP